LISGATDVVGREMYTPRVARRSPRELGPDDLIMSRFCLRGASFDARIAAAGAGGFAGIGLFLHDYEKLRASGLSDDAIEGNLADHGLVLAEIECLMGWSRPGQECERMLETADHLARRFGVRHFQTYGEFEGSLPEAAQAFGAACDRVEASGLRLALEFLPWTNVPDAGVALEIVERADRRNGGLCVDSWHHYRGADDDELLRRVAGDRVVSVQIDDAPRSPELPGMIEDTMANRRVPGEGEFPLVDFVRTLDDMGVVAPLSVEVISDALGALPPAEAVTRMAEGTRGVVDLARTR